MQYRTQSTLPLASQVPEVVMPIVQQIVKVASEFFAGPSHASDHV